jgi:type IV conjugative transfer system protein TraE
MDFKIFSDDLRDAGAKYRLLLCANILLALMLSGLAIHTMWMADRARVIVVPTHLAAQVEMRGERASPEYVRIMLLHMTNLLYTYTPYSIMDQYREFLAYLPPEKMLSVKEQLQHRIDRIAKLKINETFLAGEVLLPQPGVCLISGKTVRWSAGQELATEELHLKYEYQMKNGGFRIEAISLLTAGEFTALRRNQHK